MTATTSETHPHSEPGADPGRPPSANGIAISGLGMAAALIFVAINQRITISALPPVLSQVQRQTGLSSAGGGLLNAAPVFCFGLFAFATPQLIRRYGMSRLLLFTMAAVAAGSLVRVFSPLVALFAGTILIGAGIGVSNVLVPGVIKRDFPDRSVAMLGFYSLALCIGGAVSAGLTVPLQHLTGLSWRTILALWGIFAVLALLAWGPYTRREQRDRSQPPPDPISGLWRDRTAWAVTAFMGLQSFGFYALLTWLPTLFEDHGATSSTAGWLLSFSMFPSTIAALGTPVLRHHMRRPVILIFIVVAAYVAALVGLISSPLLAGGYIWMALMGAAQGASLAIALGYIVARSPDTHHAAALSTMSQGVGYTVAGTGPFILGAVHGATGSWTVPLIILLVVLGPMLAAGIYAGRDRFVLSGEQPSA